MSRGYPTSKVQDIVLNALGVNIKDFAEAERWFKAHGFSVTPIRDGRTTRPEIRMLATEDSGAGVGEYIDDSCSWPINYEPVDLAPVAQYIVK